MSPDERLGGDAGAEGSAALSAAFSAAFRSRRTVSDSALSAVLAAALLSAALLSEDADANTNPRPSSGARRGRASDGSVHGGRPRSRARGAGDARVPARRTRAPRDSSRGVRPSVPPSRDSNAPPPRRGPIGPIATEIRRRGSMVRLRARRGAHAARTRETAVAEGRRGTPSKPPKRPKPSEAASEADSKAASKPPSPATWWTRISGFSSAFEACSTAAALLAQDPDPSSSSPYARRYASAMAVSCD